MTPLITDPEYAKDCLRLVAAAASDGAHALTASRQLRLFNGLYIALAELCPEEANAAKRTVDALKAAEASQLSFEDLLRSSAA